MIDIHAHILPGVDDGSPSLASSLEMARLALESGVDAMIATPHCNLPEGDEMLFPFHNDFLLNYDLKERTLQLFIPDELKNLNK